MMEETGGFEPPALQFCKLLPWATRARLQMNFFNYKSFNEEVTSVNTQLILMKSNLICITMLFSNFVKMHHHTLCPISLLNVLAMVKTFLKAVGHHIFKVLKRDVEVFDC